MTFNKTERLEAQAAASAEGAGDEAEARYRTLFETLIEGFCTIEMIFDANGNPVDYRFLEINPAFEKQTGMYNAQGKLMRDLAPDHEAHWFEIYGKVALTADQAVRVLAGGQHREFERAAGLQQWQRPVALNSTSKLNNYLHKSSLMTWS